MPKIFFKYFMIHSLFSSSSVLFTEFSCNLNRSFVVFLAQVIGQVVIQALIQVFVQLLGFYLDFFFGNCLLLKLLRMFFLVLENNPNVLKKDLFSVGILAVLVPLNLLTNLVCSLSASPNGKFRLCVSPEKQNVMQIY